MLGNIQDTKSCPRASGGKHDRTLAHSASYPDDPFPALRAGIESSSNDSRASVSLPQA